MVSKILPYVVHSIAADAMDALAAASISGDKSQIFFVSVYSSVLCPLSDVVSGKNVSVFLKVTRSRRV